MLLRKAKDRIDRSFDQPLDVESIARAVGMSAGHFSRRFREEYGEPPYSYVMTRRVERAMALLRGTDRTVTDICFAVGKAEMRFITVGPPGQPDTAIVLQPPTPDPSITDEERRTILSMMDKGTYAGVNLATPGLDGLFARIEAAGVDIVQEPRDQFYGLRDCAVRDPAGNLIRIQQRP